MKFLFKIIFGLLLVVALSSAQDDAEPSPYGTGEAGDAGDAALPPPPPPAPAPPAKGSKRPSSNTNNNAISIGGK